METIQSFIVENFNWIIVIAIVFLMVLIGYIAEKTDFGKRPFTKTKQNEAQDKQNEVQDKQKDEIIKEEYVNETEDDEIIIPSTIINNIDNKEDTLQHDVWK